LEKSIKFNIFNIFIIYFYIILEYKGINLYQTEFLSYYFNQKKKKKEERRKQRNTLILMAFFFIYINYKLLFIYLKK